MTKHKFTVIKGGLPTIKPQGYKFISAYATDTRLMGVLGVHATWEVIGVPEISKIHQFFYFDVSEEGFETYRSLFGDDKNEYEKNQKTLINSLGGRRVRLSKKELSYLVTLFADTSNKLGKNLPEGMEEYGFLINPELLSDSYLGEKLFFKLSAPITNSYEAVHYYIMRYFDQDSQALSYLGVSLSPDSSTLKDNPVSAISTLCKNTITPLAEDPEETTDSQKSPEKYLCESLLDTDSHYVLVLNEIHLDPKTKAILKFKVHSNMKISSSEAAMMLSRPEYVSLFEIFEDFHDTEEMLTRLVKNAMTTPSEDGRVILTFNKENHHVKNRIFRLNDDVFGIYYVTDYGQLIVAAYEKDKIQVMEDELKKSPFFINLIPSAKYEFKEPVLYEFIRSDFEEFEDFIDFLMDPEDQED